MSKELEKSMGNYLNRTDINEKHSVLNKIDVVYEINIRLDTAEWQFRGLKDVIVGAIKMKQWEKKGVSVSYRTIWSGWMYM